jgi:TonB-linked SusC/RagA family outer membrane protein
VLPADLYAQDRTVTGTVLSDDSKTALTGVTIRVKGTRRITQTDANGKFSIKVNTGEILQISSVGYETTDVKVGSGDVIGLSLKTADNTLGEVVVTAMDIKRNPRELGYSVQKVSGSEVQETQRENFLNSLAGRVAGLTLDQTSGVAGASSSIVLRGFNSISLSNQPLYVLDGVIMDNSTMNETSSGGSTIGLASDRPNRVSDYQNRIADINPNDIETITVLKGPEATALYGSQASSGAILITTRKAKTNKLAIQYDNSFRFQQVTRFPEILDIYSSGINGVASNTFRRFGPLWPAGTNLYDNRATFYQVGSGQTHNLGVDFGVKNSKFRISGSMYDQTGVVPNNNFRRYNARIANTTKLFNDKLEITPAVSYVNSVNNKVLRANGSGLGGFLLSLYIWPSNNDIRRFENDQTGDKLDLFDGSSANNEWDNPLWSVNNNFGKDWNERVTYTTGINYNPTKWLTVSGRFGYDTYEQKGFMFFHPQSFYVSSSQGGALDNYWRKYTGYNHTVNITARKKIGKHFNMRIMAGQMWQDYKTQMKAIYGTNIVDSIGGVTNRTGNGLIYKNGNTITNNDLLTLMGDFMDSTVTRPLTRLRLNRNKFGEWNYVQTRQLALFGEFALSFKNLVFFNYTHRFEEASTLPKQNRRYDYPGASLSMIVSDLFPEVKKGGLINYWKLRTSLASTARLNSAYSTQSVFVDNLASGGGSTYGFFNNALDLMPEQQKTYELGTEIRLLKNRISAEITYYNTLNQDQIIEVFRLSYGTGFVLNTQNAGSTRNKGIEIVLDYSILNKSKLKWDTRINFNRMRNKVIKLPASLSEYYIADSWAYTARGGLRLGGPTTAMTGSAFRRNNAGQILINPANGLPAAVNSTFPTIGDRNADFTIGWQNNFRFKNFRLSFLWDLKVGGDVFNGTDRFLTVNGLSNKTADRYVPRVIQGVLEDGLQNSGTPTINNISIIPAYNDAYYANLPDEVFMEKDVNWFRLRDITLSYSFSDKLIRGVKNLSAFITANEVFLISNYSGADPGVNANTAGSRGVGGFGYDFGTLAPPVSINFGLRASF